MHFIESPQGFHQQILKSIASAKDKIILSSLYFGSDELEEQIINALRFALEDASRLQMNVTLIFDYNRSSRDSFRSLRSLFLLSIKFPERFKIFLMRMPIRVSVFPVDWNEILNVYHCKFCLFDDNVILTGANLSNDYFKDRQDRYWYIDGGSIVDEKSLSFFFVQFSEVLKLFCFLVQANGSQSITGSIIRPIIDITSSAGAHRMNIELNSILRRFSLIKLKSPGTTLKPVIQFARVGVVNESEQLLQLVDDHTLSKLPCKLELKLSSPYPSFTAEFSRALGRFLAKASEKQIRSIDIVLPSSSAHGFHSGAGLKRYIPELHVNSFILSLRNILTSSTDNSRAASISNKSLIVHEYDRPRWTFHAKGVWLFQRDFTTHELSKAIAYVGSSNLGERSWLRDFELGFLIHTYDGDHVGALQAEYSSLVSNSSKLNAINYVSKYGEVTEKTIITQNFSGWQDRRAIELDSTRKFKWFPIF